MTRSCNPRTWSGSRSPRSAPAESVDARARAHQACRRLGDVTAAARCAFWIAFVLVNRGQLAPGDGWIRRAQRLLDEGEFHCAEPGYLRYAAALCRCSEVVRRAECGFRPGGSRRRPLRRPPAEGAGPGRAPREMVRVTRPGGRVLVIAYGSPAQFEALGVFLAGLRAVFPDFEGLPDDPPPLEFQVADPDVLRRRLAEAGGPVHADVSVIPLTRPPPADRCDGWGG